MRALNDRPIGSRCTPDCRLPVRSQAHCSVCHRTLSGVTYFDQHRRDGWCVDLPDLGLVEVDGLWSSPAGHAQRAQLVSLRDAA